MAKSKDDIIAPIAQAGDLSALLKKLRESTGYTIPQTADAMCLSENIINLLEQEDFENLPEPPYLRGYLRNYAKLAETNADELIACYESLRGANPSELNYHFKTSANIHSLQKKRVSPVIFQLLSLALLLGALIGISMIPAVNTWIKSTWDSFSTQATNQTSSNPDNPLLTGTMPVPTSLPSDISKSVSGNKELAIPKQDLILAKNNADQKNKALKKNDKENKSLTSNETSNVEKIQVGDEVKAKSDALIPTPNNEIIKIKLVFDKEVWLRIKDKNKKTVFEGQNKPGKEKMLSLKKPLTFRVGNAQGLSLFVDGKSVDISSYIKGSIANFTLE